MNKLTWVLFSAYFGLFVLVGVVFYYRFSGKFLASGAQPENVQTKSTTGYIYYGLGNNLFRVNPELTLEPESPFRVERYQSTGEVFHLDASPNGAKISYDSKNSQGFFEIWQVDVASHIAELVATRGQSNLGDFQDFQAPKYSPSGTKLAFIASKTANDTIFIKNIADGTINELLTPAQTQLTDFTWFQDDQRIIYCTRRMQNLTENGCWRQTITQGQAEKIITADVLEIKTLSETSLLYLAKVHDTTNIFSANPNSRSTSALTDLAAPNLVNSFQLDPAAKTVVYEVRNEALRNIYASNRDGGNRIQLTNDNQSQSPVISPNGLSVAYLKPGDGIYVSSIDKLTNQKITNLAEIARLLVWR